MCLMLEATWPLPGGCSSLLIVEGSSSTLAWLHLAPSLAAEGLRAPPPVASLPCAGVLDAASPLAGKSRDMSLCQMLSPLGRERFQLLKAWPWCP